MESTPFGTNSTIPWRALLRNSDADAGIYRLQDEIIKGHLVNLLNEIPGFNMKRLLKLRLDMLNCLSNKLEIRPQVFSSVITVPDIIFQISTAIGGFITDLHPDTPMNTETSAIISVITVSRCLSLLDNSPVSLAFCQRSLFFIRRKAEDFLKNLPRQCAGVPKRN